MSDTPNARFERDNTDFQHVQDLLDEGEIPFLSIRMVACFDVNGEPAWHAAIGGDDLRIVPILGHIELLKQWCLQGLDFGDDGGS